MMILSMRLIRPDCLGNQFNVMSIEKKVIKALRLMKDNGILLTRPFAFVGIIDIPRSDLISCFQI